ncbi:MAG: hypothetical protein J5903_04145, partial [Clostridia bacterium]|nr:hypothetical protein [Clostridia bacterium]
MKKPKVIRDEDIGNEVVLYEDGVYRWKYELSLYKNPDVFLSVWKIFLFIFLGVFLAVMTADAVREKD